MPLRNSLSDYRYAYQGQEKDPETGKEAFELRLWDARIGRWLTTDPYGQYHSPYLGMGNDPINGIDPDGGYRTWFGAFRGWIAGGFKGSISGSRGGGATPHHNFSVVRPNDDGSAGFTFNFGKNAISNAKADGFRFRDGLFSGFSGNISDASQRPVAKLQDNLNNRSDLLGAGGRIAFDVADNVVVFATSFDLLSPNGQPQHLNGSVAEPGSSEHQEGFLNGFSTVIPTGLGQLKLAGKALNTAQFSSAFKGTFVARLAPATRGKVNRIYNFVKSQIHGGRPNTIVKAVATKIESRND